MAEVCAVLLCVDHPPPNPSAQEERVTWSPYFWGSPRAGSSFLSPRSSQQSLKAVCSPLRQPISKLVEELVCLRVLAVAVDCSE